MRALNQQEILAVSGAGLGESLLVGIAVGGIAGSVVGATTSAHIVSQYRLIGLVPGVFENVVKTSAVAGACLGAFGGMMAVLIFCDD